MSPHVVKTSEFGPYGHQSTISIDSQSTMKSAEQSTVSQTDVPAQQSTIKNKKKRKATPKKNLNKQIRCCQKLVNLQKECLELFKEQNLETSQKQKPKPIATVSPTMREAPSTSESVALQQP